MLELSVLVPFVPRRPEQVLPFAGLVNWTAAARLWQGQSLVLEPHQGFAGAAGAGFRVPVGLGVTLMPLRHPYEAALQARSLALATGHPVIAGFGTGSRELQANMVGEPYASPLTLAGEYVRTVRGLLDGEVVRTDGRYLRVHAQLAPAAAPRVDVGLGVLRPGMARLAGEVADVVITWLTPPSYIRDVLLPAVREGMARAGRTTPPRIVAMVPVGTTRDGVDPEHLVVASNAAHLQAPHYLDMLRRAGIEVTDGDLRAVARAVAEAGAFVTGDLDTVMKRLEEYRQAGVDEVVLNTTGVHKVSGAQAAIQDLKSILGASA
ncbi:LLM class flavin-dependent oxidoreductase [Streptomyces sp. NPDC051569]|uniref:LLM class flavin-dependent oxidoreductase n=1 Tax=Streptomyces sp. NPDC051569 TaxID=3365661 RepID=UPI00378808EA